MPSECHCSHCNVDGHVTAICIKKMKKESANVSEVKEEKKETVGKDKPADKLVGTPPKGGQDFSLVRGQANLLPVTE